MKKVLQRYDGTRSVELEKELALVRAEPDGHEVWVVHKRLPDRDPRGAVVLIHGLGQNRYTWHIEGRSLSGFLASEGWDVYLVDLRGHGRSKSGHPHRMSDHIEGDLPAVLDLATERSGASRAFLLGHSMGGLVAYGTAAVSAPERVCGVVTLGTPYRFGLGSRTLRLLGAILEREGRSLFDDPSPRSIRGVGRWLKRRRRLWDTALLPWPLRAWAPGSTEPPILEGYLSRAFDVTSLRAVRELALFGARGESSFGVDYSAAFEALDRPLLVIAGSRDRLAPPPSVQPAYARSVSSDRTYREVPLGHIDLVIGREAPVRVWPLLSRWLAEREEEGRRGLSKGPSHPYREGP